MQFCELEKIMLQRGITTLADIARALNTTSQEVSNWKYRNHVPYYITGNLKQIKSAGNSPSENSKSSILNTFPNDFLMFDKETTDFSIFKVLSNMVEQLKVILLVSFITFFLVFTYVQLYQQPQYRSWASVILKPYREDMTQSAILPRSVSLYPEYIRTRLFTENILNKEFYTDKFGKKLTLLAILTHGDEPSELDREILVGQATDTLNSKYLSVIPGRHSQMLVLTVTASEPEFAKELIEAVLVELRAKYRSSIEAMIRSRSIFIEHQLKAEKPEVVVFRTQKRKLLTPSIQHELDAYNREPEFRRESDFYTYLRRQQSGIAYVEDSLSKRSVMDVIDKPVLSVSPFNIDLKHNILTAVALGVGLGILVGFVRSYLCNNWIEFSYILGHLIKKKTNDFILDWHVSGIVSIFLLAGLPFYLGSESGLIMAIWHSSPLLMIIYVTYAMATIASICLSIYLYRKNTR